MIISSFYPPIPVLINVVTFSHSLYMLSLFGFEWKKDLEDTVLAIFSKSFKDIGYNIIFRQLLLTMKNRKWIISKWALTNYNQ